MIARKVIDDWFADARARGVAFERELAWSYQFAHAGKPALERFATILADGGYRVLEVRSKYLRVERVERHDEASLYERCQELSVLAANHRITKFDGFDVGNPDGTPIA